MKLNKFFLFLCSLILFSSSCTHNEKNPKKVLNLGIRQKYKTLDPAYSNDYYSNLEVMRAYEPLYHYDLLKRPYEIKPLLAKSLPKISRQGLVYEIELKRGVFFHDDKCFKNGVGRELEASDVVFTFKRIMDSKTASPVSWALKDKVKDIKVKDKYIVEIELIKPNYNFLHGLTLPGLSIIPKEALDYYGEDFNQHPVGTGPFRLEKILSNQIIWVRNEKYRDEKVPCPLKSCGSHMPLVDKIVDEIVVEDQPAWLKFMSGEHDILLKIPKDNFSKVLDSNNQPTKLLRDKDIQVLLQPGINFTYFCFNMEDTVVGGSKNSFLRKAMSLALDRESMIEKFYLGLAKVAHFLIPPGVFGFDPNYKNPYVTYDLVQAKDILEKNGHPLGEGIPEIILDAPSDTSSRQIAEYFQISMAKIGIKIKLQFSTWPEFMSKIRTKKIQLAMASWLYDYPDPENAIQLLYSENISPGPNEANYKNPKLDKLYLKLMTTNNEKEKKKIILNIRKIFEDDMPWILGVHKVETRLVHPWVQNFVYHDFEYQIEKYLLLNKLK